MLLLGTDTARYTVKYKNDGEDAEYWTERGLIHYYDYTRVKDGRPAYGTCSIRDMADRLRALNDMVGNSKRVDGGYHMPDEVNKLQTFLEQMVHLCKVAQQHGDPTNVRASAQRAEEAMKKVASQAIALGTQTYTGHKGTIYTSPPPKALPGQYSF